MASRRHASPVASTGPEYFDLGSYRRPIRTNSLQAHEWFNRGLIWCFGFHHEEALRCFERAAVIDPGCVMAYWGIAYALGPNYNKPWSAFDNEELWQSLERAQQAILAALRQATRDQHDVEYRLVKALENRTNRARERDVPKGLPCWNRTFPSLDSGTGRPAAAAAARLVDWPQV